MKNLIQMPTPGNIMRRSSSITNAFVNSLIPIVIPNEKEVREALQILQINPDHQTCAFCGDTATEWDHLRPLVIGRKPTGFITEIANLVPACGKCNQSKGNKPWRSWINSNARLSPKSRGIPDLGAKIEHLEDFEKWRKVEPINFEEIVGSEMWITHWENCERVINEMKTSQEFAVRIRTVILEKHAA
jgi:hypothetical protein